MKFTEQSNGFIDNFSFFFFWNVQQRLKEALNWRKSQEAEVKMNVDQAIIDQKRQEQRTIYEKELQKRRDAGRKRSYWKMKTKEVIVTHEGPQLSIVLKGRYPFKNSQLL